MSKKIAKATVNKIEREHQLALGSFNQGLTHAIRCGEMLAEVKQTLPHGEFTSWIGENCTFTDRSARHYMRLFKNQEQLIGHDGLSVWKALEFADEPDSKTEAHFRFGGGFDEEMEAANDDLNSDCDSQLISSDLGDVGSEFEEVREPEPSSPAPPKTIPAKPNPQTQTQNEAYRASEKLLASLKAWIPRAPSAFVDRHGSLVDAFLVELEEWMVNYDRF